jgi:hypothetical protein
MSILSRCSLRLSGARRLRAAAAARLPPPSTTCKAFGARSHEWVGRGPARRRSIAIGRHRCRRSALCANPRRISRICSRAPLPPGRRASRACPGERSTCSRISCSTTRITGARFARSRATWVTSFRQRTSCVSGGGRDCRLAHFHEREERLIDRRRHLQLGPAAYPEPIERVDLGSLAPVEILCGRAIDLAEPFPRRALMCSTSSTPFRLAQQPYRGEHNSDSHAGGSHVHEEAEPRHEREAEKAA